MFIIALITGFYPVILDFVPLGLTFHSCEGRNLLEYSTLTLSKFWTLTMLEIYFVFLGLYVQLSIINYFVSFLRNFTNNFVSFYHRLSSVATNRLSLFTTDCRRWLQTGRPFGTWCSFLRRQESLGVKHLTLSKFWTLTMLEIDFVRVGL